MENYNRPRYFCLFEQSGTFKNQFRSLGYEAWDYDIMNDYGETDYQMDLLEEIKNGYESKPSIFDEITPNDMIIAFFPCIRFQATIPLAASFRGEQRQQEGWDDEKKLEYSMKLQRELTELYLGISKLVLICLKRGLRLMIENPYTQPHYLTNMWCIKPKLIDGDRRRNGDVYKKPTQYYFINCDPENNMIFEGIEMTETKNIYHENKNGLVRSKIHPQYANRFIRQFLIKEE